MRTIDRSLLIFTALIVSMPASCSQVKQVVPEEVITVLSSREDRFVAARIQKGKELEREADYVEALKQYKIALTVDPSRKEAIEGKNLVEASLSRSAEEHFRKGLDRKKQGRYEQARHEFLTALRFRPDYVEAQEMIVSLRQPQVKGYVVHRIQPGESLSLLAATYYGDHRKFPIIAGYNNLSDAAVVSVGQEIKIPELEGFEFSSYKAYQKKQGGDGSGEAVQVQGGEPYPNLEAVDQVSTCRELGLELYREKRYEEALAEFNKVLSARPNDKVAVEHSYQSYFEMAMALYAQKDYLAARDHFRMSLQYKKDCQKCHSYIKKSEELYKAQHYKQGIRYYGKERLTEAINEWEMVRAVDPKYKRVEYYINKAKEMLKRLEDLREELNEGSMEKESEVL